MILVIKKEVMIHYKEGGYDPIIKKGLMIQL